MKTQHPPAIFLALLIACMIIGLKSPAQNNLQKAQDLMAVYDYPKAIDMYTTHFKANTPGVTDLRNLADCYLKINETKPALECMTKVVSSGSATAGDVLLYASLLKTEGRYAEAIDQYESYKEMVPEKSEATDLLIHACEQSMQWIANPEYFDVTNLANINTENSDFGLFPANDGFLLTSDRKNLSTGNSAEELYNWTGNPYLKAYYIPANESKQPEGAIKIVNDLNYKYHNSPGVYNWKDNLIYFTRTKMVRVKKKPINPDPTSWYDRSTAADYTNRLEIFTAKYKNGNWSDITAFEYNRAEDYSVGHPAISPDGKVLYFVSDMPGGYGETDIYYCLKRYDKSWSAPKNAGPIINTPGKEVFPYMDGEGTLYFSSDGQAGMGGLDIFSAQGSKDKWLIPENLRSPINSSKDDFSIYYTETGKSGYLSSNRDGGKGNDDIYRFVASPPVNLILAIVTKELFDDNSTAVLKNVNLDISNTADNSPLPFISGIPGYFYAIAGCNEEYEISGSVDGFFASSQTVKTACVTKHDTVFVELLFKRIVINKPIVLRNIYYDFDKWNIRPDAAIELDKLVTLLVDNPDIKIELGSHTDCRGSDEYNRVLSQKRAESAVNYIVSKGIDKNRITAKGYGESVLVNQCSNNVECTDEEHQMNRRTEFKVTSYKGQVSINY